MIDQFAEHVKGFANSELSERDLIANFAMGLSGESGEVLEVIKKYLYHGDPLDLLKLKKEMGDVVWYWFALLQLFDITPEEVMQLNIDKLRARHGGTAFNREMQRKNHD